MAKKKSTKSARKEIPLIPQRSDRDRRVRQSERFSRILRLLNLIQSRGRWDHNGLADELQCSARTVYRDLQVLEFAGVPYYVEAESGLYKVRSDFRFPILALTNNEAIAQAIATKVTMAEGLDILDSPIATSEKIKNHSSDEVKRIFDDIAAMTDVLDLKMVDHSKHHEMIRTIQFAQFHRLQLSGMYDSPYDNQPAEAKRRLTIHPYRLCLIKDAWYLIGHIENFDDVRTLRVARFTSLRSIDKAAKIDSSFDLKTYIGNAWSVYRGAIAYDIELEMDAQAGRVLSETQWHPSQKVVQHKSGTWTVTYHVDGLEEIANWILRWTGSVSIIKPLELRSMIHERLRTGLVRNPIT